MITNIKAAQLRNLLRENDFITGVGARDALDARMIEQAGFHCIWASGFCISASYGLPDASILSMKHFLDEAKSINEAINIPVVFDADTGYGNAINVMYVTKILDEYGMAAICLEDKRFPKDTSLLDGGRQQLVDPQEFAGKIKAAKDARRSEDFMVIARTEALIAGMGQQEALDRAMLYAESGADCIFIHSKSKTPDEIIEFIQSWESSVPLMLVPTSYPDLTEEKIQALGKVKIVMYANQVLRASVQAVREVLDEIKRSKGVQTVDSKIASLKEIFELQDVSKMKENEKKYLTSS